MILEDSMNIMTSRSDCTLSESGVGVGRWGMPPGSSLLGPDLADQSPYIT